jgi:hypothetical protein
MAKRVAGGSMRSSGVGAGGGIGNRTIKHSQGGRKVEPKAMGIRPGHAAQIGTALGNKAQDAGAKKLNPVVPPRTGGYNPPVGANTNSKPVQYGNCGTQAQHGAVAGTTKPQGRDILSEFGAESPSVGPRK